MHSPLSFHHDSNANCTHCIPLPYFFCLEHNYNVHDKGYLQFLSFKTLPQRLCDFDRCGHWSPEFAILFQWNPQMSTSTLVPIPFQIQSHNLFHPETRNKPDALTRQWDVYLNRGWLCQCHPQNYHPYSLQGTGIVPPSYHPINLLSYVKSPALQVL